MQTCCPNESLLLAYAAQDVNDPEREAVESHLAECRECRLLFALTVLESFDLDSLSGLPGDGDVASTRRFEVLSSLGSGAFGTVYEAIDNRLERKVALKYVPNDRVRAAQTLSEARALGRLNHPNVVTVFEVSDAPGGTLLVMELVEEETLMDWINSSGASWRTVVEIFAQVGRGLAAVHAAGLVHRDVKPQNIVIGEDGRARLVDFGLARSNRQTHRSDDNSTSDERGLLASHTTFSEAGTPAYMAPEQLDGNAATESSDQFSLCVAFFEALYEIRPFSGQTVHELRASIMAAKIAVREGGRTVPRWLRRVLRQGLAADSSGRFESIDALVAALEDGLARRRRAGLASAALGLGTLLAWSFTLHETGERCERAAGSMADVWNAQSQQELHRAITASGGPQAGLVWESTQRTLTRFADRWTTLHIEVCDVGVGGAQSEVIKDRAFGCLERARLDLRSALQVLARPEIDAAEAGLKVVKGLPRLDTCIDLAALQADAILPLPDDPDAVAEVEGQLAEARALMNAGAYAASLQLVTAAGATSVHIDHEPTTAAVAQVRGVTLDHLGRYDEAQASLERALGQQIKAGQWGAAAASATQLVSTVGGRKGDLGAGLAYGQVARGLVARLNDPVAEAGLSNYMCQVLRLGGRPEDAEVECREAIRLFETTPGTDPGAALPARNALANLFVEQGKHAAAIELYREILRDHETRMGASHPEINAVRGNLAAVVLEEGRPVEAEELLRQVLEVDERNFGSSHPALAHTLTNLGNALSDQGRYTDATELYERALTIRVDALGPNHVEVARARGNLGNGLAVAGDLKRAESELVQTVQSLVRGLGPEHPSVATWRENLAAALLDAGRYHDAKRQYEEALAIRKKHEGNDSVLLALPFNGLGTAWQGLGNFSRAEASFREALRLREQHLRPDHPRVASSCARLGALYLDAERIEDALPLLERAWSIREHGSTPSSDLGESAFSLARALWPNTRARPRALRLAEQAARAFAESGPRDSALRKSVTDWIDLHRSARSDPTPPKMGSRPQ